MSGERERFRHILWKNSAKHPIKVADNVLIWSLGIPVIRKARLTNGMELKVLLPDPIGMWIRWLGDYEPEVTEIIYKCVAQGMMALDIGAHVGAKSAFLKERVGENGQVVAFEPTPLTYIVLLQNAGALSFEAINSAVSDRTGVGWMQYFGVRELGLNTLRRVRIGKAKVKRKVLVPLTTLDDFIRTRGSAPNFMKIDAENSEWRILRGARTTILRHKPDIVMEVGDLNREAHEDTQSCLDLLADSGYKFYRMEKGRLQKVPTNNEWGVSANILASAK